MWTCDSFYSQEMESPSNPGQFNARTPSVVDLRLLDPVAQRLDPNPQLTAHPGDHAEAVAIFGDRLAYHADRALPQLRRVPPLAGVLARVRCGHVTPSIPKKWSLHRTQGSSMPGRRPSSTSACLTQLRSDSTPIPS